MRFFRSFSEIVQSSGDLWIGLLSSLEFFCWTVCVWCWSNRSCSSMSVVGVVVGVFGLRKKLEGFS